MGLIHVRKARVKSFMVFTSYTKRRLLPSQQRWCCQTALCFRGACVCVCVRVVCGGVCVVYGTARRKEQGATSMGGGSKEHPVTNSCSLTLSGCDVQEKGSE